MNEGGTPPSRSLNSQSPVDHNRKHKEPMEMQQRWGQGSELNIDITNIDLALFFIPFFIYIFY